ncbi:MAG: ATP-binding protein [Spirochaetaceae bacterium]|nr:ATP-binding protein [Spirochaetaceae bacterium]
MKFGIENLGIIKKASFNLNALTIITGDNNSGKTYITEAVYGLLKELRSKLEIHLLEKHIDRLEKNKKVEFLFDEYQDYVIKDINRIVKSYQEDKLYKIFASNKEHFEKSKIIFELISFDFSKSSNLEFKTQLGKYSITNNQKHINIILINDKIEETVKNRIDVKDIWNMAFSVFITEKLFKKVEYFCAERSSIDQFQLDIDSNRSKLINTLQNNDDIDVNLLLENKTGKYPLVVSDYINMIRDLRNNGNNFENKLANSIILKKANKLIGGNFEVLNDKFLFHPNTDSNLQLLLSETSSSVCSLLGLNYFLFRNLPGSILFIDEPEMNLHPKNQRELARLIVAMMNFGYKVIISTHSDIIIREINTMILFNYTTNTHILEEEGYSNFEKLDLSKLNCYTTKKNEDNLTYSLEKIKVNKDTGIEIASFDNTVEEINRIQDRLL